MTPATTPSAPTNVLATMEAITEKTKIMFCCSPNNPTGNLLREKDIAALCAKFKGIVVLDRRIETKQFARTNSNTCTEHIVIQ